MPITVLIALSREPIEALEDVDRVYLTLCEDDRRSFGRRTAQDSLTNFLLDTILYGEFAKTRFSRTPLKHSFVILVKL